MKIKNVIPVLLVAFILTSCTPAVKVVPTETVLPAITSIPSTSSITPTLTPEKLGDAKDLPKWIDDFVHAYGGKVTVNGMVMDASRLTEEIRKNADAFTQVKKINGTNYSFLLVNDAPLAIKQTGDLKWAKVTLRILADAQNFRIGTLLSDPYAPDMNLRDQLIVTEFNLAMIETLGGTVTEPRQNEFDFTAGDKAVQLATENQMYSTGNDLIYGADNFEWGWLKDHAVFNSNGMLVSTDLTTDQLISIIENHIQQVMTHYKGKVSSWVVVNESGLKAWHPGKWDPDAEIIGDNYVDIAFEAARATKIDALLIYNQNSNDTMSGSRYSMTLKIVKRLQKKNLIDAVGLQMHINRNDGKGGWKPPSKADLITAFTSYGLPVVIRELDVDMRDATGTDQEKNIKQADVYKSVFEACIESGVCHEINFWGVGDKYSWLERENSTANPTILNDDLSPKPAYYSVAQVLYEHLP